MKLSDLPKEFNKSLKMFDIKFDKVKTSGEKFLFFLGGQLIAQIPKKHFERKKIKLFEALSSGLK